MFTMVLLGKNENTQQSGDNSINVHAGGDVSICTGLSYNDVKAIARDVFRSEYEKLTVQARETAREQVEGCFDRWLPCLPEEKFQRFKEPKVQFALHDIFSSYLASDADEDMEKILLNALKNCLDDESTQKNAIIRRAVQILPMLTKAHINYLSFVLCFININVSAIDRDEIIKELRNAASLLYSEEFFKDNFVDILNHSGCLQYKGGLKKLIDFEQYSIIYYPHLFTYSITRGNISSIFGKDLPKAIDLFTPESHHSDQLILKVMTQSQLITELRTRGLERYTVDFFNFLSTACPREQVHSFLQEISPDLLRFAKAWNDEKLMYSWQDLTAVGRAIAIFNCKTKITGFDNVTFWV